MKKKLNLNQLKVTSFVTNLSEGSEETVKGGGPVPTRPWSEQICDSAEDCGLLSWPDCNQPSANCGNTDVNCGPQTSKPFMSCVIYCL